MVPVAVGTMVESPVTVVRVVEGMSTLDQVFSGVLLESFYLAPMKWCENIVE
jgi:hypothetical protein